MPSLYVTTSQSSVVTYADSAEEGNTQVCFKENGTGACFKTIAVCKEACQIDVKDKEIRLEQEEIVKGGG